MRKENRPVGMSVISLEDTLVARAQQGDRSAYSELVRGYYPGVIRVVYHLCGNTHIAEDAAQETFLRAWLHISDYHSQGSLRSWLYRIAVNAALDMLRRERKMSPESLDDLPLTDRQPGPEAVLVEHQQEAIVRQAVHALPPASRSVLVLREYQGLSYQEIATILDIPLGTVMSRLNYARNQLRMTLQLLLGLVEVENG
jgi:RNA polymerase sigma-70 factor (ECF subfamily)